MPTRSQLAGAPLRAPLDSHLRRFARGYRRRLRSLAKASPRLGELLYSFPGAAVTLAAGERTLAERQAAVAAVKLGRPLAEVAAAIAAPLWMRHLPPEAFAAPISRWAEDQGFARRIVNLLPQPEASAMWLQWVSFAAEGCDAAFAEWIARQRIFGPRMEAAPPLLPLTAFAWFSSRDGFPACGLISRPWRRQMSFSGAVAEAQGWVERIIGEYCCDEAPSAGGWRKTQKVCGYRFIPLMTPHDLNEEGEKMNHCAASLAPEVLNRRSFIYSIRRGGQRLATVEVRAAMHGGAAVIAQLRGPGNGPAPEGVERAALQWLARQGKCPLVPSFGGMAVTPVNAARWEAAWRPYWSASPQAKPRLREAGPQSIMRLRNDLAALQRLTK